MWYDIWKFSHQSLQRKIFWVPQWYPYYPKNHLIHLNFWIENISMERTNVTLHANVVPNGTQKNYPEKYKFWAFQRRVNHLYSHPRSKVTSHSMFMIFWYSIDFAKISLFVQNNDKIFNFYKDAKTHPDFMITRAIRRLKA